MQDIQKKTLKELRAWLKSTTGKSYSTATKDTCVNAVLKLAPAERGAR
jgi:hypothetical protein